MPRLSSLFLFVAGVLFAAGCTISDPAGPNGDRKGKDDPTARAEGEKYLLPTDPGTARSVIDLRKDGQDGDDVLVVGRIGGSSEPLTEGRAIFLLSDESLNPAVGCSTPWDYCNHDKKAVAAARVTVKLVDDAGKTIGHGAREMFGVKELSTVVVKGKVRRDDKENVVVLARAVFVRPNKASDE